MSVTAPTAEATNTCPQCGTSFRCGMEGGDTECWCARLPAFLPVPSLATTDSSPAGCLCPDCLNARLAALDR